VSDSTASRCDPWHSDFGDLDIRLPTTDVIRTLSGNQLVNEDFVKLLQKLMAFARTKTTAM